MLKLCILVPAKDEELVIGRTIESILRAGVKPEDIHIVDDGSSDRTYEIAKSYGVWVMRNEKNVGKAHSIALAVQHFQLLWHYDLISLMDADTRVDENYFNAAWARFESDENVTVVCGRVKSVPRNWLTAYRCYVYFVTHLVYKKGQSAMGVITVAPGCAATYRTSIFSELRWDNDTLVEDADVTVQIHLKKLGTIAYEHDAVVHTQDPKTLHDYTKQMHRWYVGAWQIVQKYKLLFGTKKINLETMLLMGEGLLFSIAAALLPLWLVLFPRKAFLVLSIDWLWMMTMCVVAGIVEKRKDVVLYAPIFQLIRYIDCLTLICGFWSINIRRKKISGWFFVNRYTEEVQ